jgi:hypothetical protein
MAGPAVALISDLGDGEIVDAWDELARLVRASPPQTQAANGAL